MKIIVVILLLVIIAALFSGLFFLVRDPSQQDAKNVLTSLKWRIGLSIALIVLLALAFQQGWIKPHGVYAGAQPQPAMPATTPAATPEAAPPSGEDLKR